MTCRKVTNASYGTYQGGYCTRTCTVEGDCPTDSECVSFGASRDEPSALCTKKCRPPQSLSSTDCRTPGYACYGLTDNNGQQLPDGVCWIYPPPTGDAGPPSDKVGAPCTTDTNCQNPPDDGFCFPPTLQDGGPSRYAGGYCSAECNDNGHCGDGGTCITFNANTADEFSACQADCNAPNVGQANCRTGYACLGYQMLQEDGGVTTAPSGICRPRCDAPGASCTAPATCNATTGLCQ